MAGTTVPAMSRPKQFENHRWMGDKRNQRVYDLDNITDPEAVADVLQAETFICFGPDTLVEARNRCYKPAPGVVEDEL
ncbi:MAG: hypothetical protein JWN29_428 [Acidimicrobiales bacterium]|nr:hypothetical protein [Acidimicrobiales bacterium]